MENQLYLRLSNLFQEIFQNNEVAAWAFDCMEDTTKKLGITSEDDPRLVISYRRNQKRLHFTFCKWLLLGFYCMKDGQQMVRIPLLKKEIERIPEKTNYEILSESKEQPAIVGCAFSLETTESVGDEILQIYDQTLQAIHQMSTKYTKSPYRKFHDPALAKVIFDKKFRESLFTTSVN